MEGKERVEWPSSEDKRENSWGVAAALHSGLGRDGAGMLTASNRTHPNAVVAQIHRFCVIIPSSTTSHEDVHMATRAGPGINCRAGLVGATCQG